MSTVSRQEFESAVILMKQSPDDVLIQNRYVEQLRQLTTMLFAKYKMPFHEADDAMQEMMLTIFKKKLHERIDPDGDPLAFYWSTIKRDIWKLLNEKYKNSTKEILHKDGMHDYAASDEQQWEDDMLRDLGFKLEDFTEMTEHDFGRLKDVPMSTPKRGRPSQKDKGKNAKHWEDMFVQLKADKQVTEQQLFEMLPLNKKSSLTNPNKSIRFYMKLIANREGFKLSITDSGKDHIYILVGV